MIYNKLLYLIKSVISKPNNERNMNMLKYYTILALSIVGNVATSSAAQMMHEPQPHEHSAKFKEREEVGHMAASGRNQASRSSDQQITIDFNEFYDKDPYELEEQHQLFFQNQKFTEAAKALIGSAMNGDSENMDYILRLDPKASQYIANKDLDSTRNLVKRIAEDLAKQFQVAQNKIALQKKPFSFEMTGEAVEKKIH
jgi:hypothetical protein